MLLFFVLFCFVSLFCLFVFVVVVVFLLLFFFFLGGGGVVDVEILHCACSDVVRCCQLKYH